MTKANENLPGRLAARFPDPRIEWTGFVDRVQDVQARCAAFLAPIRSGGGSKLKVLEAMAAGLPIICTGEAASDLRAVPGHDHLRAETVEGLAAGVIRVLQNVETGARIGDAARFYVRNHHDWPIAARAMEQAWEDDIATDQF